MVSWLTGKEWEIAWEVYAHYTGVNKDDFIRYMEARGRRAGERFDAYTVAHKVCAELQREVVWDLSGPGYDVLNGIKLLVAAWPATTTPGYWVVVRHEVSDPSQWYVVDDYGNLVQVRPDFEV